MLLWVQPLLSIDPFGIDMFGCDNYGARARTSHRVSHSRTPFLSTCRDLWIITFSPLWFSSVIAAKEIPWVIIRSAASLVHRRIIFCFRPLQSGATNIVLLTPIVQTIWSLPSPRLNSTWAGNYNNESGEKLQHSHCSVAVKHPVSFLLCPQWEDTYYEDMHTFVCRLSYHFLFCLFFILPFPAFRQFNHNVTGDQCEVCE